MKERQPINWVGEPPSRWKAGRDYAIVMLATALLLALLGHSLKRHHGGEPPSAAEQTTNVLLPASNWPNVFY